jgi:hypothetical protein
LAGAGHGDHELGRNDQARQWLDKAERWIDDKLKKDPPLPGDIAPPDWLWFQ